MRKQQRLSKVELMVLFLALGTMPCEYLWTNASAIVQKLHQNSENCNDRPIGQTFQKNDCEYCICHMAAEEPRCYFEECWDPKCVDSVTVPGECCERCPNGPNCQYEGIVIKAKEQIKIGNLICCCLDSEVDSFGEDKPKAVCISNYL